MVTKSEDTERLIKAGLSIETSSLGNKGWDIEDLLRVLPKKTNKPDTFWRIWLNIDKYTVGNKWVVSYQDFNKYPFISHEGDTLLDAVVETVIDLLNRDML
jgi:hypothetical protein